MLTAFALMVVSVAAKLCALVAAWLSRATKELASALDDLAVTTLAVAFGRQDRRMPSGERPTSDRRGPPP
jgi:hypothetical protein